MSIAFRNCRHEFGQSLRFDVEVNGVYPEGDYSVMLSQPSEVYHKEGFDPIELRGPLAFLSIPSPECARAVVDSISDYHLCNVFRKGEPINVSLCWEDAPEVDWQIAH